jgi:hypothetical protein
MATDPQVAPFLIWQVAAALKRSTDALSAGDLVGSFDGWNSLWGDYWSDYPGRTNFGPTLFTNITGGTDTENVWFSGGDPNIPDFGLASQVRCECAV